MPAADRYWLRLPLIATRDGVGEAIAQAPSHPEGASSYAAPHIAELLARTGRTEEAVSVLEQHASANSHDLAGYLIDLGRIEDALAVLQRRAPPTDRAAGRPLARRSPVLTACSIRACWGSAPSSEERCAG
ncbi:hypothetical protein [Streptomyces phaeoluteigriseus]